MQNWRVINDKRFEVHFNAGENIIKQGIVASNLVYLTSGPGQTVY